MVGSATKVESVWGGVYWSPYISRDQLESPAGRLLISEDVRTGCKKHTWMGFSKYIVMTKSLKHYVQVF